ncbi:heme exporter protein CcmB [Phenylobacterium zucineum HLK1]|uniref:Heme exporter protein B n=1 Tax=Phenylobacterium zucineum (strain HLK1) TaxID=450851 RepID=B4RCF4_PHEZH|nr:heme exporter protein CcmB [Phenylobacterium zucineum]ACG76553.1 heme exporter protein CcmB [Phenylobacterium zucineum HLK1]
MSRFSALLARETALAWGRGGGPLVAVGFYAGVATLIPLAIGPEPDRLAAIAPGAAWVALALASLLSLDRLFERDFEDGALDLLALSPLPLELTCAVKCLGQWLATGAPLAAAAPVAAIALGASPALAPMIFACALLGGVAFAFMGGIGAALSLGARRGGLLTAVIVLPLFVPPVIFGGGALDAFASGLPWKAGFALLGAYAAAALALGPLAMAAACRNALS